MPDARPQLDGVRPLLISSGNALAATGQTWRWCRDFARNHGVAILRASAAGGRGVKPFISAQALFDAIERHAVTDATPTPAEVTEADELDALRRRLGKRRASR